MPWFYAETTDTFGGDRNYGWLRREWVHLARPTRRAQVLAARRACGFGLRGRAVDDPFGAIEYRPAGCAVVTDLHPAYSDGPGRGCEYTITTTHPVSNPNGPEAWGDGYGPDPRADGAPTAGNGWPPGWDTPLGPVKGYRLPWQDLIRRTLGDHGVSAADLRGATARADGDRAILVFPRPGGYYTRSNGSIGIRSGGMSGVHCFRITWSDPD